MKLTTSIHVPFQFRAAHSLAVRPEPHWHTYEVIFELSGPVDPETGFVVDMGVVREIAGPLVAALDGVNLNDGGWLTAAEGRDAHSRATEANAAAVAAARTPTCECLAACFAHATAEPLNARCAPARLSAVEVKLLEDEADGIKEWGHAVVRISPS